jgi:hypothetical protein
MLSKRLLYHDDQLITVENENNFAKISFSSNKSKIQSNNTFRITTHHSK